MGQCHLILALAVKLHGAQVNGNLTPHVPPQGLNLATSWLHGGLKLAKFETKAAQRSSGTVPLDFDCCQQVVWGFGHKLALHWVILKLKWP